MNPEAYGHNAPPHHQEDVFNEPPHDDNFDVSEDFSEAEILEPQIERSEDFEGVEQTPPETAKEERLGDLDERLRLLDIERRSASRDFENWRSSPNTNPADFQYRVPYMKNRLSAAEQAISSAMIDRELVSADAQTPEAADEVVRSFIKKQLLDGKVKSHREGLKAIDSEEGALSERLAGYERTIDDFQGILEGKSNFVELTDDEWSQEYRKDLTAKIHRVSDKYEATLADKLSRDFGGRRAALEEEIRAIQELGVDDAELPRSLTEDPDFAACLSEANFNYSEDDEAYKRRTNHDPEKAATALFKKRFPNKAEFYSRLETTLPQESLEEDDSETGAEIDSGVVESSEESLSDGEKLSEIFREAGIESHIVKIEGGDEFSEIVILKKENVPTEKMMRLYRGVSHMDASLLDQVPYAMRAEDDSGKPVILEGVREDVVRLSEDPTYENLTAYYEKARPNWSPKELQQHSEDLIKIEDGILSGRSARKELVSMQIRHGGGWADSGITPYISTSTDPYEASGYGRRGLIVIDVPLSKIEDFRPDSTEINIKGNLDKKFITAILPREVRRPKEVEDVHEDIDQAMQVLAQEVPGNLYSDEELRLERTLKISEQQEIDDVQWQKDVEQIRRKRVDELRRLFPEIPLRVSESGTEDIYTKAKQDIFDYFDGRHKKLGPDWGELQDREYQEHDRNHNPKKFDRNNINEVMLLKLKEYMPLYEKRAAEYARAEAEVERRRG